jgi:hypothetical protein
VPRDVEVDILARDKTGRGTRSAAGNFRQLKRDTDDSAKSLDGWQKRAARFGKAALGMARSVGKVAATVAAATSAIGPATSGIIAATKATVAFGKAGARTFATLAPLVAFLPSLAGSAGLLVGTLRLAGPGLAKALKPIRDFFALGDTKGRGVGSLTAQLQKLVAVGVEPLARQFVKLNLPTVAAGMLRIATATNGVVRAVGGWLNSIDGQALIRDITLSTAAAAERLAPHVTAAAVALGRLAGRAGDRAITGFADLIGRILDKFTKWAESKTVEDINRALGKLRDTAGQARAKLGDMQAGLQWLVDHQGQIKAASNVLAGIAIVLGAATGNWGAVIAGGLSLIVNNLDAIKGAADRLLGPARAVWNALKADPAVQQAIAQIKKDVQAFFDGFRQGTSDIGPKFERMISSIKKAWDQWAPEVLGFLRVLQPAAEATGLILGKAFGFAVDLINAVALTLAALGLAFKIFVRDSLNVLGFFIQGAAAAFGWIPGIGPKLQAAAIAFDQFRDKVNNALGGIHDQTVAINVVAKTSSTNVNGKRVGVGEGGTLPRTGAFGDGSAWRPAQVAQQLTAMFAGRGSLALAGAGGGTSRTGGPTEVASNVDVSVSLDGEPFRARAPPAGRATEKRQAWRAKVGRR